MAVPSFVGRADELARLRARLSEATAGRPQVVVVEGPGGVGKSGLLTAFASTLEAPALTASGDEAETQLRFGILLQLLDSRVAPWADPFVAGAEFLEFLDHRPDNHPTVLMIDDAHLADSDSMTAMTFALRRLHADRVMAVFALRGDDIGSLPPGLLRLTEGQGGRLRLGGLTDTEVVEFGAARGASGLSRREAARLRKHTDGNPLYLGALIDELPHRELTTTASLPAPQSYARVVLSGLASQSEEARRLARAAAVLADGCLVDIAAVVAEVTEPETAVERLTDSGLVSCRYADDGWHLRYTHPLAKAVVYDDLGPGERTRLHTGAARLLHGEEALLHLVTAASGPDPSVAMGLARCAEANRDRGELRRAAELYLKAARMSGPGPDADVRLMDSVGLFLLAGDVAAAKGLAEALDEVAPSAQRFHLQAKIAQLSGKPAEAESLALRAWERSEELDDDRRGVLAAIIAQLCNTRGDGEGAAVWADRALAHPLSSVLADSTAAARALGLTLAGHLHEGLALLQRDVPANPADAGDEHHQLCARGVLRAAVDDLSGARADLRALSVSSGGDLAPNRLVAMGALAEVEYRLGNWDSARTTAEQALSLAEDSEQVWVQGFLHTVAVTVAAGRGVWGEAEGHLDEARGMVAALGDPATFAVCENAAVHVAFCRDQPEEVVARSGLLLSLGSGPTHEPGLLGWPVQYVAALVQLGRLDEAAEEIASFEVVARERGSRARLAALARVRGELATVRREHQAAREAFEEALAVGEGRAAALDVVLTYTSYGKFLRRRGEKRAAVDRLQTARDKAAALGAAPFVERCDAELTACGVEPMTQQPAGPALTPQEQIVATLVCQGLSNREVARHLVLSVKTVGYHLSNVYAKLDVHSRTQLVAVLGRPT